MLSQELLADDNRQHACLGLPLDGLASTYKYNRQSYHFECRLVALVWDRRDDTFRLFFDARGAWQ